MFLPLKSPCKLHGMKDSCALHSNSVAFVLQKYVMQTKAASASGESGIVQESHIGLLG